MRLCRPLRVPLLFMLLVPLPPPLLLVRPWVCVRMARSSAGLIMKDSSLMKSLPVRTRPSPPPSGEPVPAAAGEGASVSPPRAASSSLLRATWKEEESCDNGYLGTPGSGDNGRSPSQRFRSSLALLAATTASYLARLADGVASGVLRAP